MIVHTDDIDVNTRVFRLEDDGEFPNVPGVSFGIGLSLVYRIITAERVTNLESVLLTFPTLVSYCHSECTVHLRITVHCAMEHQHGSGILSHPCLLEVILVGTHE